MAYIPTSTNPFITTAMLREALYTVRVTNGPEYCQKFIKQRYSFRLVLDDVRKKLLAVFGTNNQEILIDINLVDIVSIACLDATEIKENRHRLQVVTKNSELYEFYVDTPYQFDPLPFISNVQRQINYCNNPKLEHDEANASTIGFLLLTVLFSIWTIIDWVNDDRIVWGIFTPFLAVLFGILTYIGIKEWNK